MKTTYSLVLGHRARDVHDLAGRLAALERPLDWDAVDAARRLYATLAGEPPRLVLVLLGAELAKPEWDAVPELRAGVERIFDARPLDAVPNDSVGYNERRA